MYEKVWAIAIVGAILVLGVVVDIIIRRLPKLPGLIQWGMGRWMLHPLAIYCLDEKGNGHEVDPLGFRPKDLPGEPGNRFWFATIQVYPFPRQSHLQHVLYTDGKRRWRAEIDPWGEKMTDGKGRLVAYPHAGIGGNHRLQFYLRVASRYEDVPDYNARVLEEAVAGLPENRLDYEGWCT